MFLMILKEIIEPEEQDCGLLHCRCFCLYYRLLLVFSQLFASLNLIRQERIKEEGLLG